MACVPSFSIDNNLIYLFFTITCTLVRSHKLLFSSIRFNPFVFSRPGRLTNFMSLGQSELFEFLQVHTWRRSSASDHCWVPRCWSSSSTDSITLVLNWGKNLLLATSYAFLLGRRRTNIHYIIVAITRWYLSISPVVKVLLQGNNNHLKNPPLHTPGRLTRNKDVVRCHKDRNLT